MPDPCREAPSLETWIEALRRVPEGRIWWANLVYDVRSGNLPCRVFARLRGALRRLLRLEAELEAGPLRLSADAKAVLVADVVDTVDKEPSTFHLQGSRCPQREPLGRVIDAWAFAAFHVAPELGEKLDDRSPERVVAELGRTIQPEHYRGLMRTARAFFWATTARHLHALVEDWGEEAADRARDQLGLGHIKEGTLLLQVTIPEDALEGVDVRAPTTLDAGGGVYFAPSDADSGYGWTRCLPTMEEGLPEVLVGPLPLSSRCTVSRLGRTSTCPVVDLDAWAAFCEGRAGL